MTPPVDVAERYRIYAVRGSSQRCLATTPTPGGVGVALVQLHEDAKAVDRRLADEGRIGVYDALLREWIVLPYGRKETP